MSESSVAKKKSAGRVARAATGKTAVMTVSKTVFNQETEEKEYISIRPFATETVKVGVKFGRTINLGNYESARVDVSIEAPCYVEEAADVYNQCLEFAAQRIAAEADKIVSAVRPEQTVEELL